MNHSLMKWIFKRSVHGSDSRSAAAMTDVVQVLAGSLALGKVRPCSSVHFLVESLADYEVVAGRNHDFPVV